ncbi:hypothetical protein [Kordia sp. SMS9]|uniref:hypothetical protein n=1 Tax=Kordia sp. SMS9 TaxID=2282170 RepID=UPI0013B3DE15|nr:hypothetical protein [Kordia sp. SMS9]
MLVLCALFLQPIIKTYTLFADASYELVDYDFDDDSEKEFEDTSEKDEKVTHNSIHFMLASMDLSLYNSHFYVHPSDMSYSIEILIPPPEMA